MLLFVHFLPLGDFFDGLVQLGVPHTLVSFKSVETSLGVTAQTLQVLDHLSIHQIFQVFELRVNVALKLTHLALTLVLLSVVVVLVILREHNEKVARRRLAFVLLAAAQGEDVTLVSVHDVQILSHELEFLLFAQLAQVAGLARES